MKTHVLGLSTAALLIGCIPVAGANEDALTAEVVVLRYLQAVQRDVGKDPQALGYEKVTTRLHELGEEHLLKNKVILHRKAADDYLKLDELKSLKIDSLKRIYWDSIDKYKEGNTITPPNPEQNKVGSLITMFAEGGYGIAPYSRESGATTWWHPLTAAKFLKRIMLNALLPDNDFQRRMALESLVEPSISRLNSDPERPSIGFFDGKDLIVIDLKYTDVGIYSMAGFRWASLDGNRGAKKPEAGDGK